MLSAFVQAGLIYESCEKTKDGLREYHNAVFVGKDEHGAARHAHKRSVSDAGRPFRINVEGCDPRYSFHHAGTSGRLYVFEAPIDLLSFISLYQKDWQKHSYVALCGTSEHAMLRMLEQSAEIRNVILCLDHDEAGTEAAGRLADILWERGYEDVSMLLPEHKDWNEDVKARRGYDAQCAEEHPQLTIAPEICGRIALQSASVKPDRIACALPELLDRYRAHLQSGRMDKAMDCVELMSAHALHACGRELKQMGKSLDTVELAEALRRGIRPHENRGGVRSRYPELEAELREVLARSRTPGIRSLPEKERLARSWFSLAVSCTKISVKHEADEIKMQKKQEIQMQMG